MPKHLLLVALLSIGVMTPSRAADNPAMIKALSYCIALSTSIEQETPDKQIAQRWLLLSARYAIPLTDMVPTVEERRTLVEAAMRDIDDRGTKLQDSKRLLAAAYESVRASLAECNGYLKALESENKAP